MGVDTRDDVDVDDISPSCSTALPKNEIRLDSDRSEGICDKNSSLSPGHRFTSCVVILGSATAGRDLLLQYLVSRVFQSSMGLLSCDDPLLYRLVGLLLTDRVVPIKGM